MKMVPSSIYVSFLPGKPLSANLLPAMLLLVMIVTGFRGHTDDYPKDFFRSPLDIPLVMAGNFAEMRANHFHSGLDLKTKNREGLPVYAAADGWVSRVKVSPYGYGNVLYVSHPNGYTTVYAHLQGFSQEISDYVRTKQYASNQFEIDKYLSKGAFPITKGDVIAASGNSGGSFGPHLHFEIRSSKSQMPLNPLLFGLQITDTVAPKIFRIKIYPQDSDGYVEVYRSGSKTPVLATREMPIVVDAVTNDPAGKNYQLSNVDKLLAHGRVGFGIQVHDYHNGSRNRLGAYTILLESDEAMLFQSELAKFTFGQTRYINAHVDYGEYREHKRWIQRSHRLPGNALDIYAGANNGFLLVEPGSSHELQYVIADAAGNRSTLSFQLLGVQDPVVAPRIRADPSYRVIREESKTIAGDKMRVHFRSNTFYEDIDFVYSVSDPRPDSYSPVYALHNSSTPLHRSMTLSIQADGLPEQLRPKALMATVSDDGKLSSAGGSYRDGFVVAKPRSFGNYTIAVDTVAPALESWRFPKDGQFSKGETIQFKVNDEFSGIRSYAGFVDSKWVLFEYDAKKNLLSHHIDGVLESGLRKLVLRVEDGKGNVMTVARSVTISD